jgi:hypothetical protein
MRCAAFLIGFMPKTSSVEINRFRSCLWNYKRFLNVAIKCTKLLTEITAHLWLKIMLRIFPLGSCQIQMKYTVWKYFWIQAIFEVIHNILTIPYSNLNIYNKYKSLAFFLVFINWSRSFRTNLESFFTKKLYKNKNSSSKNQRIMVNLFVEVNANVLKCALIWVSA